MNLRIVVVVLLLLQAQPSPADQQPLRVFTCEPEWAALAQALGGDRLDIDSATTFMQDPHHIQARPSLIAKARRAGLLICTGAELEIGWLPLLLRKSGNGRIQPGQPGYFMATQQVQLLQEGAHADRSAGDVHSAGNPHIHFDPRRMLQVAEQLTLTLQALQPEHSAEFEDNLKQFREQLQDRLRQHTKTIDQLRGHAVMVHHNSWVYLLDWLGMKQVAELEPKPGLPPSSSHLASLVQLLRIQPADVILYSSYQDPAAAKWLSARTGIPALALPYSVADWRRPSALSDFYINLLELLQPVFEPGRR